MILAGQVEQVRISPSEKSTAYTIITRRVGTRGHGDYKLIPEWIRRGAIDFGFISPKALSDLQTIYVKSGELLASDGAQRFACVGLLYKCCKIC